MAHLQYLPGDPRLVDQLVCELKSKGIFDQFRKECIADVDTRPAYQNLRQRVESSVATFLSRQVWNPDLNKNQLREKLRKHLLDGNYLEQGVERIVDQVVNPKVASVFIPQVEDLVYNYLGIPRKKATVEPETSNGKPEDLLPTDLEAVSPGSVKSNDDKNDMDTSETKEEKMEVDDKPKLDIKDDSMTLDSVIHRDETRLSGISELTIHDSDVSIDKSTITIPLPAEEIKLENIPAPENSPPKITKNIDLEKITLPQEPNLSTDIPLPDEIPRGETESFFKPIALGSEDEDSSGLSLRRNVSPLTPVRNFNNENSCDAQQAFEIDYDTKSNDQKEPSSFRFTIEKSPESCQNSSIDDKIDKKPEPVTYQYNPPSNSNAFNTPMYDDSSNSNNLKIDYESDSNSKAVEMKAPEAENSVDLKKEVKKEERKSSSSSHKSSHRSRDSHRHSSSKDKRSESKHSHSRDSSKHDKDKKTSSSKDYKEEKSDKNKSSSKEKPAEKSERKDSRDSSKHRSSSSSHKSSRDKDKDSKHRTSSSTSSKHSSKEKDEKKSSSTSSSRDKERSSDKYKDKERTKDSKSSSSKDKDRKSSSSSKRSDEKENKEKKDKKETDDHYSLSGRGNPNRRSTDRDSNDGSSSSKGSHNPSHSKTSESKKETKSSSKSGHTSSSDSTSPSDTVETHHARTLLQSKPVVRVDTRLETPISTPPRLPFVPNVTMKKPKFAANLQEAKQLMKMRKFLEEEQKRMNQEAALLLEFQASVRPNMSQVYSNVSGPELEFTCPATDANTTDSLAVPEKPLNTSSVKENKEQETKKVVEEKHDEIAQTLIAMHDDDGNETQDEDSNHFQEKEHTDASVLSDLTDQEDSTNESEIIEVKLKDMDEEDDEIENKGIIEIKGDKRVDDVKTPTERTDSSIGDRKSPETDIKQEFKYFSEQEKFDSELERDKFAKFYKNYTENVKRKIYLINCDTYEENIIREAAQDCGKYEIVNYIKNGRLKLAKTTKNIVKNVNVATEITLPTKVTENSRSVTPSNEIEPAIFSPVKSECSFELSSDYDAKIEEMVNKASRQQIMEIILGGVIDENCTKMPTIDYCDEANIEHYSLKRKITEADCTVNNNIEVLTPSKIRKLSGSDQITSTTEESEISAAVPLKPKSKFLGKAKRVGLSRPKKTNIQNSPSSDKSVENYETDAQANDSSLGKMKSIPRSKVQRYDTSDLYKPKLHYLSRRNQIT